MDQQHRKKIVILGAGYGGVMAAKGLCKIASSLNADITLVNRHMYHQMITKLHEPAGGQLDGNEVRIPLHQVINNVNIVKDDVKSIDTEGNQVILATQTLRYDILIVALGADPEYFGIPGLKENSHTLRSLNTARLIKVQIENCLAKYKIHPRDEGLLNFVIGGAGFTGVEMAGELAEWLPQVAPQYDVPLHEIKLYCVEAAGTVLPGSDEQVSRKAGEILSNKGVELKLGVPIKEATADYVMVGEEKIPTKLIIWTGGVRGNAVLAASDFDTHPRSGRANINQFLQSVNHENVFIIGDSSVFIEKDGRPLAPTAQIAMQQGDHVVTNLAKYLRGEAMVPFVYVDRGVVASIGQKDAVGRVFGKYHVEGTVAVYMKKLIHYRYLFKIGGIPLVFRQFFGLLPQANKINTLKNS